MSKKKAALDGIMQAYHPMVRVIDKTAAVMQNGLFAGLTALLKMKDIPSFESRKTGDKAVFFSGTDGEIKGTGWKSGYAEASVIPAYRRRNGRGVPDEKGYCLDRAYATGGYQTYVSRLYTDQLMHTVILSSGADGNGNGIDDILIFISVDGAGLTAGTVNKMRKAITEALAEYSVTEEDIVGCNVSATHCHGATDTLGMSVADLVKRGFRPYKENGSSLDPGTEKALISAAVKTVKAAYENTEKGELYFFETDKTDGVNDKLGIGVKVKNTFSCLMFEGEKGTKTIISNIGAHPTSYGAWRKNNMMCADYPYFMAMAMKEAGYGLVFTQSAQASVSGPYIECSDTDENAVRAAEYVKAHGLSKEEWTERFGAEYTEVWYDELENSLRDHMKKGFLLADFVMSSVNRDKKIEPLMNIKNSESLIPFNFGVMQLACVAGLLGGEPVKTKKAPSGYGTVTETDYLELGGSIVMLTAPGELSPALVFGSDPGYKGRSLWNGISSWAGKVWQYDTLENMVKKFTGEDKKFMLIGITNNELGYIYPDICTPSSLLATLLFFRENAGDMTNCMLLTPGTKCGSAIMEQYKKLLSSIR